MGEIEELRERVRDGQRREEAARLREWDDMLARLAKVEKQLAEIVTERDKFRGAVALLRIGYVIIGGILVEIIRKLWPNH